MELRIALADGSVDVFRLNEQHETQEDGELWIFPENGDYLICKYAAGMWVSARRILERGEDWPVTPSTDTPSEVPNHKDIEDLANNSQVENVVRGILNGTGN